MELSLQGKTARVTGGSRGIGVGAARVLHAQGAAVGAVGKLAARQTTWISW